MKIKNILSLVGISLLGTGISGGVNSIVNELRNDFKCDVDVKDVSSPINNTDLPMEQTIYRNYFPENELIYPYEIVDILSIENPWMSFSSEGTYEHQQHHDGPYYNWDEIWRTTYEWESLDEISKHDGKIYFLGLKVEYEDHYYNGSHPHPSDFDEYHNVSKHEYNLVYDLEKQSFLESNPFGFDSMDVILKDGKFDIYSFENDLYKIDETQKNFYDFNQDTFYKNEIIKPYFTTNELTYYQLENLIKEWKIIESRDNVPIEYSNIIFYDKNNNIIDKNSFVNSNRIYFDLVSNEEDSGIIGSSQSETSFPDTNGHLSFNVPFISYDPFKITNSINVYDFEELDNEDPTDNESSSKWEWQNDGWHLISNELIEMKISNSDFKDIQVGTNYFELNTGEEKNINYSFFTKEGEETEYNLISNSIHSEISSNTNYGRNIKFYFDFESQSNNDNINVIVKNDAFLQDGFGAIENRLMVFDSNKNGITDDNEIYKANSVSSNFKIENGENIKSWRWDYVDQKWQEKKYSELINSDGWIDAPGMYGFSKEDEYGNVSFELVEYKGNYVSWEESELTNWNISDSVYFGLINYADDHNIQLDELSYHETRALVKRYYSSKSLNNINIDLNELQKITSNFEQNTIIFSEIQQELENEIYRQLNQQLQINNAKEIFDISWNINPNDYLTLNQFIGFKITPNSLNFDYHGEKIFTFNSNVWINFSNIELDNNEIEKLTNLPSGIYFSEIQKELENEIYSQLMLLNINIDEVKVSWNKLPNEKIYINDDIEYNISSSNSIYRGNINGNITFKSDGSIIIPDPIPDPIPNINSEENNNLTKILLVSLIIIFVILIIWGLILNIWLYICKKRKI